MPAPRANPIRRRVHRCGMTAVPASSGGVAPRLPLSPRPDWACAPQLRPHAPNYPICPALPCPPIAAPAGPLADAISALVNLGYRRAEAYGAVAEAARRLGPEAGIDHLIRAGLKELSP